LKRIIYIIFFVFITSNLFSQVDISNDVLELNTEAENYLTNGNKNLAANSYYKIATKYWNNEDYDNSKIYFEKALNFYTELNNKNAIKIIYSNLGQIYTDLENYESALVYFNKSLDLATETKDNEDIASQLLNIATIESYQKKYGESNTNLIKALQLAQQANNTKLIRSCYGTLAENYEKLGDSQKSIEYYNFFLTFEKLLNEQEISNIQEQSKIEIENVNIEKRAKELELALEKYKLSEVGDSLKLSEYEIQRIELENQKLEKEKLEKDLQIEEQKSQRARETSLRNTILIVFGIVLIFSFVMFFQIKQKNKANKLLNLQKKEIENQSLKLATQNKELVKLSIVASKTDNSVIILDKFGYLEWANEAFKNIWGYNFEEYKSIHGDNLLNASNNEQISISFAKCSATKKTVDYVSKFITKFGEQIWTHTTLTPILSLDGEIEKVVAIDSNITDIKVVEEKLKDSILYASKIQMAIIPKEQLFNAILPKSFVMFQPRDIVSGDFYWLDKIKDKTIIVAADCTGHGVPGALLSILGISFLSEILKMPDINTPAEALNLLRVRIKAILMNTEDQVKRREGLDIAICSINHENNSLDFAGAYNPLYIVRNGEIEVVKGDKMPVGVYLKEIPFTNNTIEIKQNDRFYIFSDGFIDQFGGDKNDKFKTIRFKKLIFDLQNVDIRNQKKYFENSFNDWKGTKNQMDDILVVGFEV
jgi:PAS domain S-box-containing protein